MVKKRTINRRRRYLFAALFLLALCFIFFAARSKIEKIATAQVERLTRKGLGFPIRVSALTLRGFRSVVLHDLQVEDRGGKIAATAKRVFLRLDPMQLLRGHLVIEEVLVKQPTLTLRAPSSAHTMEELSSQEAVRLLGLLEEKMTHIPLSLAKLRIDQLKITEEAALPAPRVHHIAHVQLRQVVLGSEGVSCQFTGNYQAEDKPLSPISVRGSLRFHKGTLQLTQLSVRSPSSYLEASATLTVSKERDRIGWRAWLEGEGKIQGQMAAEDMGYLHPQTQGDAGWAGPLSGHLAFAKRGPQVCLWTKALHYAERNTMQETYWRGSYPFSSRDDFYLDAGSVTLHTADVPRRLINLLPKGIKEVSKKTGKVQFQGTLAHSEGSLRLVAKLTAAPLLTGGRVTGCMEDFPTTACAYTGTASWKKTSVEHVMPPTRSFLGVKTLTGGGSFAGRGFPKIAALHFTTHLSQFVHEKGRYEDLSIQGDYTPGHLQWEVDSKDPTLSFHSEGTYEEENVLHSHTVFRALDVQKLRLSSAPAWAKGSLTTTLFGDIFSRPIGDVKTQLTLHGPVGKIETPSLRLFFLPSPQQGVYTCTLHSRDTELTMQYHDIKKALTALSQDVGVLLRPQPLFRTPHNEKPSHFYDLQVRGNFSPFRELLAFYGKKMTITHSGDHYTLHASNDGTDHASLTLRMQADDLQISGQKWTGNTLYLHTTREGRSASCATFQASSQHVSLPQWPAWAHAKGVSLEQNWEGQAGKFSLQIADAPFRGHVKGTLFSRDGEVGMHLLPTTVYWMDEPWRLREGSNIVWKKNETGGLIWQIDPILVHSSVGQVRLEGSSQGEESALTVHVDRLPMVLENFLPTPTEHAVRYVLNGIIECRETRGVWTANSTLHAPILSFERSGKERNLGALRLSSSWQETAEHLSWDAKITREKEGDCVTGSGWFYPFSPRRTLRLDLDIKQAPLDWAGVLVDSFTERMRGQFSGQVAMELDRTGLQTMTGNLSVTEGLAVVNLFGINTFSVSSHINIREKSLYFQPLVLTDVFNQRITMHGSAQLVRSQVLLALQADLESACLMDATRSEKKDFSGKAYASGSLAIRGALTKPHVTGALRGLPGTALQIPLPHYQSLNGQTDTWVRFREPSQPTNTVRTPEREGRGAAYPFTIDVQLSAEEEVYAEVIFDDSGDERLRGFFLGDFRLVVDESGKISAYGHTSLTRGHYQFQPHPALSKQLSAVSGGTVTWDGDPLKGEVQMSFTSTQDASVASLVGRLEDAQPETAENYMTHVTMNVNGKIPTPNISFDIAIEEYPVSPQALFPTKKERSMQAISLIFFRRFAAIDGSVSWETGSMEQNVSELLSSRISRWLAIIDEDLSFRVSARDITASNPNLQLGFAHKFLDKRLSIAHHFAPFEVGDERPQRRLPRFVGDWEIEYLITRNGAWRVRSYLNSSPQRVLFPDRGLDAGVSFRYVKQTDGLLGLKKQKKEGKADHPDGK